MGNYLAMEKFKEFEAKEDVKAKLRDMFSICQGFVNLDDLGDFTYDGEDRLGNINTYPSAFEYAFHIFFNEPNKEMSFKDIEDGVKFIGATLMEFNNEEFSDFLFTSIKDGAYMTVAISLIVHEI